MRKAKIILSAIAIFAVAGGAFAFKATRVTDRVYYCPAPGESPTTTITGFKVTGVNIGATTFATSLTTGKCTITWVTAGL